MTGLEIIAKLNAHGIYHLRQGESAQDALDFVDGKLSERKGIKVYSRAGRRLTENEIRQESWKEAFTKHCSEPEFKGYDEDEVTFEDCVMDCRNDTDKDGEIEGCKYCGSPIRVDYEGQFYLLTCEAPKCINWAILKNCM